MNQYFKDRLLGKFFGNKSHRKDLKLIPKDCYYCELLGICRDEENNWKCIDKCLLGEDVPL